MTRMAWCVALAAAACGGRPVATVAPANPDDVVWGTALADFERNDSAARTLVIYPIVGDSTDKVTSDSGDPLELMAARWESPSARSAWVVANLKDHPLEHAPPVGGLLTRLSAPGDSAKATPAEPFIVLSAIGYSTKGDTAIVAMRRHCGEHCFAFMRYQVTRDRALKWQAHRHGGIADPVPADFEANQRFANELFGDLYAASRNRSYGVGPGTLHGQPAIIITIADPAVASKDSASQILPSRDLAKLVLPRLRDHPKYQHIVVRWSQTPGPGWSIRVSHDFLVSELSTP